MSATSSLPQPKAHSRQLGFTLVELMVGVLLGMLTVLVIAQVLAQAEGQRRTVSTGGDAEVNGSLSLFSLQRDIQMAGYGLATDPSALGCPVKSIFHGSYRTPFNLAPIVIENGASGAPDSITVTQGNSSGTLTPMLINSSEKQLQDGPTSVSVVSDIGTQVGDFLIAVRGGPRSTPTLPPSDPDYAASLDASNSCRLIRITGKLADHETIQFDATNDWNQPDATAVAPDNYVLKGYATDKVGGVLSYLVNVGRPSQKTYSVSGAYNLQVTERVSTDGTFTTQDLYPQIINLQALYGLDKDGDGTVDEFTNAAPTDWTTIISVRVAVVARSNQFEKEKVTSSAPVWDVGATIPVTGETLSDCGASSKCITLKVNHLPEWEHYRYKVYSTTVPLRNVLWHS